jgi:DNA-binding CsgD family transcriptional regulator
VNAVQHMGEDRRWGLQSVDLTASEVVPHGLPEGYDTGRLINDLASGLASGRGGLVLVTGERGMGRTRWGTTIVDDLRAVVDVVVTPVQPVGVGLSVWEAMFTSIVRIRPEGPAANLSERIAPGPNPSSETAEQLALAVISEATHAPLAVMLDDIDLADDMTHDLVGHLLTVIGSIPLLLIVTAATGWATQADRNRRWQAWVGRDDVLHLPITPLSRCALVAALAQVCPARLPPALRDRIIAAAQGNPRIAQEIALWTLNGSGPVEVPPTALVRELVNAHDVNGLLTPLAVANRPLQVRTVAAVVGGQPDIVRRDLDRACAAGLLEEVPTTGRGDGFVLAHPIYAAIARDVPRDVLRRVCGALADQLQADFDGDDSWAPEIVRLLLRAQRGEPKSSEWSLRAARWCLSVSRLEDAAVLTWLALGLEVGAARKLELVELLAQCCLRLGRTQQTLASLRKTFENYAGQAHSDVDIFVSALAGQQSGGLLMDDTDVVTPADEACLPRLSQADAWPASFSIWSDPADGEMKRLPEDVINTKPTVMTAVQPLEVDGLAADAAAALAQADRDRLDFLIRRYARYEGQQVPDRARDELALLNAVVAILDGRRVALSLAFAQLANAKTPTVAAGTALLSELWSVHTGGHLQSPTSPGPGRPHSTAMSRLLGLLTADAPSASDIQLARAWFEESLDEPQDADGMLTARLAAAARVAVVTQDLALAAHIADALTARTERFVLVDPYLPVGPMGWFVEGVLRLLGRHHEADAALREAQQACDELHAVGWSLRIGAAVARSGPGRNPRVEDVVEATVGPVAARRVPEMVAQIRGVLRKPLRSVQQEPRSADSAPAPAEGPGHSTVSAPATPSPGLAVTPQTCSLPGGLGSALGATARNMSEQTQPDITVREREIMKLASRGLTNREISREMFLSVATVERHCTNLYRRLGVRNRAQALVMLGPLA